MTDIVPVPNWGGVRQLETNEYATGGLNGNMNEQAKALAGQNMYSRLYAGLPFDPAFTAQVGGFPIGGKAALENGEVVESTVANNIIDPNIDMTKWVFSSSGLNRTQEDINNDWVNVRSYGAVGDGILHTVNDWTVIGSRVYYPSLAAIQIDYPFVSSLSDSVDWAGIQRALNTGKHVLGPFGRYQTNESLYYKTDGQQVLNLGSVNIDASLGKPCIHIGASDKAGTPHSLRVHGLATLRKL